MTKASWRIRDAGAIRWHSSRSSLGSCIAACGHTTCITPQAQGNRPFMTEKLSIAAYDSTFKYFLPASINCGSKFREKSTPHSLRDVFRSMKSLRKKPRCKQLAVEYRTNSQGDCSYLISASPSPKLYGSRNLPDRNASLDGLPVELKWAVLQEIPDLPTLQSLIRASPAYYYAYNGQLQPILSAVLASDMGLEGFVDACALLEACTIKEGPSWAHDMIQFMTGYQVDRALCLASDLGDVNRLVQIMQFHRMVHDMTKKFSQDALAVHPEFGRPSQVYEEKLSSTEVHRFHRGFYRFQIICVLFGKRHDQVFYNVQGGRNRVSERTRFAFLDQFLSIFDPWEVEEINCIVLYIFRYYHAMLEKTDFNLDPEVLESVTRRRSWRLYRWEHTMEFLPQSSSTLS